MRWISTRLSLKRFETHSSVLNLFHVSRNQTHCIDDRGVFVSLQILEDYCQDMYCLWSYADSLVVRNAIYVFLYHPCVLVAEFFVMAYGCLLISSLIIWYFRLIQFLV